MSSKYSFDDSTNSNKLSFYGIFCIAIAVFGSSFQVGWHIGVYNTPVKTIQEFFNQTYFHRYGEYMSEEPLWTSLWSLTNALNPAGGIIGGLASGFVADYFGRKKGLLLTNVFTLISGVLAVISKPIKSYEALIVGRFFAGIQSGLFLGIIPLYLSEIPSKNLRGITGCLNQLLLAAGILVANVAGIPQALGTDTLWPYLVALTFVPMLIHLLFLPCCTETPKYVYINERNPDGARQILKKLRKNNSSIEEEILELKVELDLRGKKFSHKDFIQNKVLLKALIITMVVHATQQFSGINAVVFYSTQIFISIGLDANTWAEWATILLGFVQVGMTFVAVGFIERAGRKPLLLAGIWGMAFFAFALAVSRILVVEVSWFRYVSAASAVLYVMFFSIGPGPIPWLITSELFNSESRGKASSVAVFINFSSNFIVTLVFPYLEEEIGSYSFIVFGALLVGFGIFAIFQLPETKNRTVDEVYKILKK